MTPHNTWSIIISRFLRTRTLFVFITGSKKQADLATAKAFVGSCTDMCPEKERYDREEKRRLHNYEVLQGTEGVGGGGARLLAEWPGYRVKARALQQKF